MGKERRKKGGAQHRPYGMDEPRTSNREIATAASQPRNDRKVEARNDRKNWGRDDRKNERRTKTFPLGGRWQPEGLTDEGHTAAGTPKNPKRAARGTAPTA